MSRYTLALLASIGLFIVLGAPALAAGEDGSPVVLLSGSPALSIEDADVNYSAYDSIYGQSAHVSVVTAQLYLEGRPYNRSGIMITFSSDNDSVAVLEPQNRSRPSDERGQAKILLIANNTVGIVNITALSHLSYGHDISDTCTVRVVGWGTVSGVVTDKYQKGVPNAKMTLWRWNGTANDGMLKSHDNPQLTNDGSTAAIGTYTFTYVPQGVYNLTAEKDGHVYFAMVHMTVGTYTANVAFPDYVFPAFITPTPTPAASATSTTGPSPSPTPTPVPGFEIAVAVLAIGLTAWAALRRID